MQNKDAEDPRVKQIMGLTKSYQNFPQRGINFVDVFPIVANSDTSDLVTQVFIEKLQETNYNKIFMLQSIGFIFGVSLAQKTSKPCYPIRKKGKLPGICVGQSYGKQYGKYDIQVQKHCVDEGDEVVIVDGVLATGETLKCAVDLLKGQGAKIAKILTIVELDGLNGRKTLGTDANKIFSLSNSPGKNVLTLIVKQEISNLMKQWAIGISISHFFMFMSGNAIGFMFGQIY